MEWSKFLALDETAHNSSEMHVLGLVFQVMCVHGEEKKKVSTCHPSCICAIFFSLVKHLSKIYFVIGPHQESEDRDITGVQNYTQLSNLIVKISEKPKEFFLKKSLPQTKLN